MHYGTITLCFAAAAGVFCVLLADRLRMPYIVLLLFCGVLLGPEFAGVIDPSALGPMLETVVALAVAVILFEGGLTLDRTGFAKARTVIRRLLTVGPLITWLATAALVWALFDLTVGMALLASSLVIVTGPTVVSPLLRRLNITERVHHILYWEAVLVDVVGVFVAVLCFEWLTAGDDAGLALPVGKFALRLVTGVSIGAVLGLAMASVLKRKLVHEEHVNVFVLAAALLTFGIADALLSEAGILAVVVAGLVVGVRKPEQLRALKGFKLQLTEFGIGLVFILLAAKLELARFADPRLLILLACVIFAIRPVVIWVAAAGQGLPTREKLFLSWLAPRGIVAAAMASLFASRLVDAGHPEAVWLETITYAVIVVTVTVQGLSAPFVAQLLKLERPDRRGWVLLGESAMVDALSRALRRAGVPVIDAPESHHELDLADARFAHAGSVLAVFPTADRNLTALDRWRQRFARDATWRWRDRGPAGWEAPDDEAVWGGECSVDDVERDLRTGSVTLDVLELGDGETDGRFGRYLQPLFWVEEDGRARLVPDPMKPGTPHGRYAVVLRRGTGLADLVHHVQVIADEAPDFEMVLERLIVAACSVEPGLPREALKASIVERRKEMPIGVGAGIAIPHGYWDGIDQSVCLMAVVPEGIDLDTPDGEPVRLVFLVISPAGMASDHLGALAALGRLGQDRAFVELLARQTAPTRIATLIHERG